IGARAIVRTRRSVIFNSEGLELVLTFWGSASRVSSAQNAPPKAMAPLRKDRLPARYRIAPPFVQLLYFIACELRSHCAGRRPAPLLKVQLEGELQLARRVDLAAGTGQHAECLALQLRRSGSEPDAVEYVECLGAELHAAALLDR